MSNLVNRVLLIDDSEIDLFIQRRFIEVFNLADHLHSYSSAKEALDWLRSLPEANIPDLIFLDLNMPDLDGFGFLLRFSELSNSIRAKIRVVILTSSNSKSDLDRAIAFENVVHFITKPFKQSDIETLKLKLSI